MGALHINGQKATGLEITLAEGVFIDADNLIFSYTINSGSISQTEYSYTATEDCYVRFMTCTPSANQMTKILIDNVEVFRIQNTSTEEIFSDSFLLKKGQVITLSNIGAYSGIGVYGIQQGTIEGKLQPVIYSEEEREVGVWTDGKPLYERTWNFTTEIALVPNTWTDTPIGILANNIGKIIKVTGLYSTTSYSFLGAQCDTGDYVRILSSRPSNMLVDGLILQYTKTTDTAGAGTWTPDGAYAHHYSTSEKVVGTYEGETLYERNIDITLADSSDMQTFAPGTLGIGLVKVVVDAYFKNSGSQQLRMSRWYGNDYWSYIVGSNGGIMIKRNTSDANWTTGVHFVATVQYTKSS